MWAFIHNAVAHPLLALTGNAPWATRFHDWTADRGWPATPTVCELTNELGNRIRITIEGPTSTSENVLTPMEASELRHALNTHLCDCRCREGQGDCEACRAACRAALLYLVHLVRTHAIEALAAACGLAGAWLLATKGEHAAWGWWAFLASNIGWIAFGWIRRHWFLLAQQVGFTATSLLGIWTWTGGRLG